jgi:protein-tyrosine kinase
MRSRPSMIGDDPGSTPELEEQLSKQPGGAALTKEMLLLHQSIDLMLEGAQRRVVHFTAARPGEGTSTVVRAYGRALSEVMRRSVLIIDANETHPDQHLHFAMTAAPDTDEMVALGAMDLAIYPSAYPNLSISPLSPRAPWLPSVFDPDAVAEAFARLRNRFDAVLVDSSPVLRPGTMALSSKADGVVLVIEAEKTRWPVAMQAKQRIEGSGGTLLGVVLNKRRYHIPTTVYRWL